MPPFWDLNSFSLTDSTLYLEQGRASPPKTGFATVCILPVVDGLFEIPPWRFRKQGHG
jgi:hypothetical protein